MKLYYCEGELICAESESSAREIIEEGQFVPDYRGSTAVVEVTGDVLVRRLDGRMEKSTSVKETASGLAGWLCAGEVG